MRKYINSLPLKDLKELPYHSWNCLTIGLENRNIDIVINNEEDLFMLIKFLMRKLNSVDGNRNSAEPVIRYILKDKSI